MIVTLPPTLASSLLDEISTVGVPIQRQLWRFCAEYVLGTRLEILVNTLSQGTARVAADAARAEIERLDLILSTWRSDSENSKLLQVRRASVSEDLFAVLQLSETWRQISRGGFDGRSGALSALWSRAAEPDQAAIDAALAALHGSSIGQGSSTGTGAAIGLDPATRAVELSPGTTLSLDAVAKGYIVDAALDAARRAAPTLEGMAINIGGDIRCWGESPASCGWRVGIADPVNLAENAPVIDTVAINNAAMATSGRGPRDRIANGYRSTTISPFTGRPVCDVISASVVASHTADADAIATACMVLKPAESIALVDRLEGTAARITAADGRVHVSSRWPTFQRAAQQQVAVPQTVAPQRVAPQTAHPAANIIQTNKPALPQEQRWPADWELRVTYTAFEQTGEAGLHDPYIALWITDADNKIVTTLLMLGKDPKWAKENFVWWNSNNEQAKHQIELRSRSTVRSGQYEVSWVGVDDDIAPMPVGKYVLNFEANQERGKHTYRTMPLEIGKERFKTFFRDLNGVGELELSYGAYNDRFGPPAR